MNRTCAVCVIGVTLLWPLQTPGDARAQERPRCRSRSLGFRRS